MDERLQELLRGVKEKKELQGLPDEFILPILETYLAKQAINIRTLRPQDQKFIVKEVRAKLRREVGMFYSSSKKRTKLLTAGDKEGVLLTHASTKERFPYYVELEGYVASLHPASILDLGCGLNPLALASPNIPYYALDVNAADVEIVKSYFERQHIPGWAKVADVQHLEKISLPDVDLCLSLKLFDILGGKNPGAVEKVLETVRCKVFLVSFPTITLSGKRMRRVQRTWFEKMTERLGFSIREVLRFPNEIFYLVQKSQ